MPDDMAPPSSSLTEGISLDQNAPDLVGEELGDHARIWREYDWVAREDDKERIGSWNRGLDNLALFAGLFSAVTTAFIIQLQNDLQPDYAELTFRVLNATASGMPFVEKPYVLQSSVRTINCIWISSLMVSLTAALIAIMGKDWIGMYAARPACNPRQWAEIRTYRLTCVERWYMPGVIASAPVLLHASLVLFATGLVLFVGSDMLAQLVAFALSIAAAGLYLFTVLSGIIFSTSPFKSPATQAARGGLSSLLLRIRDLLSHQRAGGAAPSPRHGRLRRGYVAALYDGTGVQASRKWWRRILCGISGLIRPSRPDRLAPELWGVPDPMARGLPVAPLEAPYRGFPLRQYVQVLRIYLSDMLLTNYWDDVHSSPRPALLAQSVSFLYERSASPDTLWLILVALGDFVIGKDVAPSVSPVILSRLTAEVKRNWQRADLFTLSRYILLDMNLPQQALIGLSCGAELEKVTLTDRVDRTLSDAL